uniref:Pollen-specific leucine-rich repeat extensin-like protein 1 n=1 Tax=Steinernema glaseri TaxID=37863 RepID=A0A1I7YS35_9BILA
MRFHLVLLFCVVGLACGYVENAENGGEKQLRRYGVIRGYRKYKEDEASSESSEEDSKDDLSRPGPATKSGLPAVSLFVQKPNKPLKADGTQPKGSTEKSFQWTAPYSQESNLQAPAWKKPALHLENESPASTTSPTLVDVNQATPFSAPISSSVSMDTPKETIQKPERSTPFVDDRSSPIPVKKDNKSLHIQEAPVSPAPPTHQTPSPRSSVKRTTSRPRATPTTPRASFHRLNVHLDPPRAVSAPAPPPQTTEQNKRIHSTPESPSKLPNKRSEALHPQSSPPSKKSYSTKANNNAIEPNRVSEGIVHVF